MKRTRNQRLLGRFNRLESREAPAVVTTTADNGDNVFPVPGSLRAAVVDVLNSSGGTITFALPGPSTTIAVAAPGLPAIPFPVTIDGTSQPGYLPAGKPLVEISGAAAGASTGFTITGGGSTVRGLVINGFFYQGLYMTGPNNTVADNYIGTDVGGAAKVANDGGVYLDLAENCAIHRNVIAGNSNTQVTVIGTSTGKNSVTGNHIGVNATGTAIITSFGDGVFISGPGNTVGGLGADINVIAGNSGTGIKVAGDANTLDGNRVGTDAAGGALLGNGLYGISIVGNSNLVRRNTLGGNGGGVEITGSGNKLTGNHVGLNVAGTAALPNGAGIEIVGAGNTVGGTAPGDRNVISGNAGAGLGVSGGSSGNVIQGNYIGTDAAGAKAVPNGAGVQLHAVALTQLGGLAPGAGNVISGNKGNGVTLDFMDTPLAFTNKVEGNLIGTDATGAAALGNGGDGLFLLTVKNHTITGNVISANGASGLKIGFNFPFGGNTVAGNFIGTDKAGMAPLGNKLAGVEILGSANNVIGGPGAARNVISANGGAGVALGGGTFGNSIQNNLIGTAADGTTALGNPGYGVFIFASSSKNTVGGAAAGQGNTIAFNGANLGRQGHGVEIQSGTGNAVRRNRIFDNAGRGIDLNADSFTINDPGGDADAGANGLQDYPAVISRPAGPATDGKATWRLNSTPGALFTIEFFANDVPDPSGFGEGKEFLGAIAVTTDAQGDAGFSTAFAGKLFIAATATDAAGNTSEFSMVDTDADALADAWETAGGLDVDEDGVVTAAEKILTGADPLRKDLFVEVDAMLGRAPAQADLNLVAASFAAAPGALVHNPDLTDGIALHATLDEANLGLFSFAKVGFWGQYDTIKNGAKADHSDGSFGTPAQRADVEWVNIRNALELTHRYCLFADQYGGTSSSGIAELSDDGWATNDCMVTVRPGAWGGATGLDRAGTFMHEFGHTLALRHGGGDDVNNKPNYRSVMNYTWQVPDVLRRTRFTTLPSYAGSWVLDYSRQALPTLDEVALNEPAGIGGAAGKFVPFGQGQIVLVNGQPAVRVVRLGLAPEAGPVDWNFNGFKIENPIAPAVDINFDGIVGQKLVGHDDWSALQFYFLESAEYADGVHGADHGGPPAAPPPPRVGSVTINDGALQRSRVTSVRVPFDSVVELPANPAAAFQLRRQSDGGLVHLTAAVETTATQTVVTLTFGGALSEGGSLADGRYTLLVSAASISNGWDRLDGNGDGIAGDDFVLTSAGPPSPPTNIFRLFGDADGDGDVDGLDFAALRHAFGTLTLAFDADSDGNIDIDDVMAFRLRFGSAV